ncbi:MAG: SDR family oxidoreductase [Spirochaetales bacterium]|nr:SDR family oxidoreductase [Spirochaetales bacterium]
MNILITGASRGIGRATALALGLRENTLILSSRPSPSLDETADLVRRAGGDARVYPADFEDMDSVLSLAERINRDFSRLDVIINNAGQALSASVEETGIEEWDRLMMINARAPYFLTRALLPLMERGDRKTIVNIASVVGHEGYPLQSAYTASKHALTGWSKSLARELQARGYRLHVLSPGGVATDMVTGVRPDIDTDQLIRPEEIGEWIRFLLTRSGRGMVDHINIRRESRTPW